MEHLNNQSVLTRTEIYTTDKYKIPREIHTITYN